MRLRFSPLLLSLGLLAGCVGQGLGRAPLLPSGGGLGSIGPASGAQEGAAAAPVGATPSGESGPLVGPTGPKSPVLPIPQELLVLARANWDPKPVVAGWGATLMGQVGLDGQQVLRLRWAEGASMAAMQQRVAMHPEVRSVVMHHVAQSFAAPNDTAYNTQWGHGPDYADSEGGWAALGSTDASKTIIAIMDSGVDATHPELAGRVEPTIHQDSKATGDPIDSDRFGHGTFCAGVAAASGNNGQGIAGVAWQARILPVKLGPGANFDIFDALAGIVKACDYQPGSGARVRVINMSFGVPQGANDPLYEAAVAYAKRRGVLIVAAVGNEGQSTIASPANTPGVLAVGATSLSRDWEVVAPFSNHGPRLDLVAPGGLTFSTFPTQTEPKCNLCGDQASYGYNSGTSFAAPYVAGVAALCFAKFDANHASLSSPTTAAAKVDAVRQHLLASCDDLGVPGRDPLFGHGRINLRRAISSASLLAPNP